MTEKLTKETKEQVKKEIGGRLGKEVENEVEKQIVSRMTDLAERVDRTVKEQPGKIEGKTDRTADLMEQIFGKLEKLEQREEERYRREKREKLVVKPQGCGKKRKILERQRSASCGPIEFAQGNQDQDQEMSQGGGENIDTNANTNPDNSTSTNPDTSTKPENNFQKKPKGRPKINFGKQVRNITG